jgi:hypothetical protein
MALDATPTLNGQRMKSHSHALDVVDVTFDGDGTYPAGGTPNFTAYIRALLPEKREVTILDVRPLGLNGGMEAIFDPADDKLLIVVKATGVEAAPGDLSGTAFRLAVYCY